MSQKVISEGGNAQFTVLAGQKLVFLLKGQGTATLTRKPASSLLNNFSTVGNYTAEDFVEINDFSIDYVVNLSTTGLCTAIYNVGDSTVTIDDLEDDLTIEGDVTVAGDVIYDGDLTVAGSLTVGESPATVVVFGGNVTADKTVTGGKLSSTSTLNVDTTSVLKGNVTIGESPNTIVATAATGSLVGTGALEFADLTIGSVTASGNIIQTTGSVIKNSNDTLTLLNKNDQGIYITGTDRIGIFTLPDRTVLLSQAASVDMKYESTTDKVTNIMVGLSTSTNIPAIGGAGVSVTLSNSSNTNFNYTAITNQDAQGNTNGAVVFQNADHTNNEGQIFIYTRPSGGNLTRALEIGSTGTLTPAGDLYGRSKILSRTADYTLTNEESRTTINNIGAAGEVVITLPTPTGGEIFTFSVLVAQNLKIVPPGGVSITSSAGTVTGHAQSSTVGSTLKIQAQSATQYLVFVEYGTWAFA